MLVKFQKRADFEYEFSTKFTKLETKLEIAVQNMRADMDNVMHKVGLVEANNNNN